ncbi:hypothetical protein ACFLZZ_00425 [Nanoarchaeota archaeon]
MTADDKWGHVYITHDGSYHDYKGMIDPKPPKGWVLHYYNRENECHAFIRHGPQRRICMEVRAKYSFDQADLAVKRCQDLNKNKFAKSRLVGMISSKQRSVEFKDDSE